jgi:hypothetical protein
MEALDKKREQDRLRQKAYYDRKKEEVRARQKAYYDGKKATDLETDLTNNETIQAVNNDNVNRKYYDHIDKLDVKEITKLRYRTDMKRIIDLIGNDDLLDVINNKTLRTILDKTEYKDKTEYSYNTKLTTIKTILTVINDMDIKLNKKIFDDLKKYMDLLTREINDEHKVKQETIKVMTFKEYIELVKSKYGEQSKMYLIANLYSELTLRDDFQLEILDKVPKVLDHNYLIINKQNCRIIITKYKTEGVYGKISVLASKKLSNLIKEYIANNNLQIGDYLLGNQEQSKYINYHNEKIGVNGAVSLYRQMKITEMLNDPKINKEDMINLAEKMKHSPIVQLTYLRQMKDDVKDE